MNVSQRTTLAALFLLATHVHSQLPQPTAAPLPSALSKATRLFVGNAGDQENDDCLRAYNTFYQGLAGLGRFQLVGDPGQAELVLELHYEIDPDKNFGSHQVQQSVRQFRVVLEDPRSRVLLWSITERTNYALFQKNRNRNLDQTIAVLVADVNGLLAPTPAPPNNDSVARH